MVVLVVCQDPNLLHHHALLVFFSPKFLKRKRKFCISFQSGGKRRNENKFCICQDLDDNIRKQNLPMLSCKNSITIDSIFAD